MSDKNFPVITITREYCAYGRTVAAALAEKLGCEFYDRDIVNKIVIKNEFSEEAVRKEGGTMDKVEDFLHDMLGSVAAYSTSFDKMFEAQKAVILDMAQEPCILVGRCSNTILKEAGIKSLDVFLYADTDQRMKRCAEINPDMDEEQMRDRIRRVDEDRQIFYKKFGSCDMRDPHNYDLCLNVGKLGTDGAVKAILSQLKAD